MTVPPLQDPFAPPPRASPTVRRFRLYASLVFSFAWVPVMYTAFTLERGFSPDQYLQLWSVYYLVMVLAELPWGWLADRIGPRPLLLAGPLVLAVGFLVLGHSPSFPACVLAMGITAAAHAMISGADSAYLYEVVVREGRAAAALHEEAVAHRWRLFGVSLADVAGGLVAFSFGTAAAFDLSAALMLGAALVAVGLPAVPLAAAGTARALPPLRALLSALLSPGVAWIVGWATAVFVLLRVGFQLYQPTLLAVAADDLRLHGGVLGLLNLVAGFAALLVMPVAARWRERGSATLVLLLLALSFGGLSLAVAGAWGLPWLLPLFALQQVSFGFLQPLGRTGLNRRTASADRTALLSAQSLLGRLAFGLVLALGSWDDALADALPRTYAVAALASLALALGFALAHRGEPPPPRA